MLVQHHKKGRIYTEELPDSVLCHRPQRKEFRHSEPDGRWFLFTINYGDPCKNGRNSFTIVGGEYECKGGRCLSCGCLHEDFARIFPELEHLLKWHLVSSHGPMHYLENSMYHAEQGNIEHARSSAVWPEAELGDFTCDKLMERLPALMGQFKEMVEGLGFIY